MPKSPTRTQPGRVSPASRLATSTPKPSSPRNTLPTPATRTLGRGGSGGLKGGLPVGQEHVLGVGPLAGTQPDPAPLGNGDPGDHHPVGLRRHCPVGPRV